MNRKVKEKEVTIPSKELVLGTITYTNNRTHKTVIQLIKYSKGKPLSVLIGIANKQTKVKLERGVDITNNVHQIFKRGFWEECTVGRGSFNIIKTVVTLSFSLL